MNERKEKREKKRLHEFDRTKEKCEGKCKQGKGKRQLITTSVERKGRGGKVENQRDREQGKWKGKWMARRGGREHRHDQDRKERKS